VFALCLAAGATRSQAAQLANVAAGIGVGKRGTACVSVTEFLQRVTGSDGTFPTKVCAEAI
jgi:bifunctional ADP-heptose synthase (sugar kinase/adenylyltransferase)